MFYPDYIELPGLLTPEGREIEFVKPTYKRGAVGHLVLYYDRIELRYALQIQNPHEGHLTFLNQHNGAFMVSKMPYNRYFCTSDLLFSVILERRTFFRNKNYEQAREIEHVKFRADHRPV